MSSTTSPLQELTHLILDEHLTVTYKWVTNHFEIPCTESKQLLLQFVSEKQSSENLSIHHAVVGLRTTERGQIYTIEIVPDTSLEESKQGFTTVKATHIYSVGPSQIVNYGRTVYHSNMDQIAKLLSNNQTEDHLCKNEFSMIGNPRVELTAGRPPPEPIQPTVTKKRAKPSQPTPRTAGIKRRLADLDLNNESSCNPNKRRRLSPEVAKKQNASDKLPCAPSSDEPGKVAKSKKVNTIASAFSRTKPSTKSRSTSEQPSSVIEEKTPNGTVSMDVDETAVEVKPEAPSTKSSKKKKKQNKTGGRNKSAKSTTRRTIGSKKKKKESNLSALQFDSESSDSDVEMEHDSEEDELQELVAHNKRTRRRHQIDDSEDDDDEPKKLSKRELAKIEKHRELSARKHEFFSGHGNVGLQKKKKRVERSYVDDEGLLVVEDAWVTDDEADKENGNPNGETHDGQKPKPVVDSSKLNGHTNGNGDGTKVKKTKAKAKPAATKTKKNGNIFAFFGKQ